MKQEKTYTFTWNEKNSVFIAKVRKPDGSGWHNKWLPKTFAQHQTLEAEQWLISWVLEWSKSYGKVATPNHAIGEQVKTLLFFGEKWLALRYNDNRGTKINTYKGFTLSLRNWILDNAKFSHMSIQGIDLEDGFTVQVCREWINSLQGSRSSKIQHINTLRSFFNDCIAEEWLDSEMVNPFDKPAVKKLLRELSASNANRVVGHVSEKAVRALLGKQHPKVEDYRRMRYLIACHGLRDHELQGLIWEDIKLDAPIPFLNVARQLDKPGGLPFVRYEDLAEKGLSKAEILAHSGALVSLPKYQSVRMIPLHPLAIAALRYWKEKGWKLHTGRKPNDNEPVFARSSTSLKVNQVAGSFCFSEAPELLRADLKRLGEDETSEGAPIVFHSLRHSFASFLEAAGVEESKIGVLMGHKSQTVTRKSYITNNLASFKDVVALLPLGNVLSLARETIRVDHEKETIEAKEIAAS